MQAKDLLRELKRTVDELAAFNEIGKTMTSTLDIREVLKIIMQKVGELLQPESWSLLLVDEKAQELYLEASVGAGDRAQGSQSQSPSVDGVESVAPLRVPVGEGIAGWAAREGEPVLVSDPRQDPRFSERLDGGPSLPERSILAVPLRVKGRTLGVIEVHSGRSEGDFSDGDVRTLASIADYAAIALENARNFQRLQELTVVDDHTGLYNSRHLQERLEAETRRARRFGGSYSIVFLDLNRFKAVNDSYGHQHGSALLREVGQVLRTTLRSVDVPVRYGGDEFVVLLTETDRPRSLIAVQRMRQALVERAFLTDRGLSVRITASFGVATFPDDASTEEELMRQADMAMYRIKEGGRNGIGSAGDNLPGPKA